MRVDYIPLACFTGLNQKIRSPQVGGFHFPVKYAPANEGTEFAKMKVILLTQGKVALVDDFDFDHLNQFKWYASKDKHYDRWYARRTVRHNGKITTIRMHRVITNALAGMFVDHWNGNGLDNQRENLRVCSNRQNQGNQGKYHGTSRFKGVSFFRQTKRWRAAMKQNGKVMALGYFKKERDAAIAYDEAAIKYFGSFARTNRMLGLLPEGHKESEPSLETYLQLGEAARKLTKESEGENG